jgi:hypothetical protein
MHGTENIKYEIYLLGVSIRSCQIALILVHIDLINITRALPACHIEYQCSQKQWQNFQSI